jgi:hypothetical protein
LLGAGVSFSVGRADNKDLQWTKAQVSNLHLVLQDATEVEDLHFWSDGTVSATLGSKNGYLCGPLLYWQIANGKLHFFDKDKGEFSEYLVLLSQDPSGIVARRIVGKSSSEVRYAIVKK